MINSIQLSFFDEKTNKLKVQSHCEDKTQATMEETFAYYNKLNEDHSHRMSTDDICTPMECVKKMIDYVPDELWQRANLKVLDPCCGNGNFGAYCRYKTSIDNIWFNELNPLRYANCERILSPKHLNNEDAFKMTGEFFGKWDLIVANPPYSGGGNKNRSLSNEFIELAISLLADKGYLCYITPNNWMTYNNDNTTLKALLKNGSFVVIDNDAKKYFPTVGSSFTIIVWQKNVFTNKTKVVNNYLVKDIQENIEIPKDLKFIPLYISQPILDILAKIMQDEENSFRYRCDLHNFTRKDLLSDVKDEKFKYETIHTPRKTRYACIKQDIYDKWVIIIPLSTYYLPYILKNVNTTQSVGYFAFETKKQAEEYLCNITQTCFKVIIHLTRYGNFNNIMVLKHLRFDNKPSFTEEEANELSKLVQLIKY
jgi:SAM-dependent methyltransferase